MASAGDDTGFYDTAYGRFADELYASIRQETLSAHYRGALREVETLTNGA